MDGYTLLGQVRQFYVQQARKHCLHHTTGHATAEDYADHEINAMTNVELVIAIGDAIKALAEEAAS